MESQARSEPSAALDRHQSRRESGLPTVSVLSGPPGLASREGWPWSEGHGRPIVEVADPRLDAMADAWADRLDLILEAVALRRLDRNAPNRDDSL